MVNQKQKQTRNGEPLMERVHYVQTIAAFFDVHSGNFFRGCRYGRLFVSALVGSFTTHKLILRKKGPQHVSVVPSPKC